MASPLEFGLLAVLGMRLRFVGGVFLFFLLLVALPAVSQETSYQDELVEQARQIGLAERRQWLTLGHYQPSRLGVAWIGVLDSPGFYLAAEGKTDPRAELEATIASLFAPPAADSGTDHPQCVFVARYHWLKAELNFDPARLPEQICPEFQAWYDTIDPAQVTLVFPSAYLNQPSSMFGHTLLRIDKAGQTPGARLHSYAINYGAVTGEDGGVVFAFKGLTGGYPGTFSIVPYYEKVEEYSDLENREIWEYELNLEQTEIRRLLMHVWEMRQAYADYYFFDENCSYQLLTLLEVARPKLDLTGGFEWWAIPTDTVRAVIEQEGLLASAIYRPSARAEIDHRLSRLNPDQRDLAYRLALGEILLDDPTLTKLPPKERAMLLELAYEYLQYRFRAHEEERDIVAKRSLALLQARSMIPAKADVPPVPQPKTRPEEGHGSARVAFGVGHSDGRSFLELGLRPAYHDLLDPLGGFVLGSGIEALDLVLRYYESDDTPVFESLTVVGIQSITPRNKFFKPLSWRLNLGAERFLRDGPAKRDVVGAAGGGAGVGYRSWEGAILYGFADGQVSGGQNLPDKVLFDLGPSTGFLYHATQRWTLNVEGSYLFALDGETENYLYVGLKQGFSLTPSLSLRLNTAYMGDADNPFWDVGLSLNWYF